MTASANNVTVPGDTRLNDLKVNRKAPFWAKIPIIKELRVAVGWQKGMLITGLLLTAFFLLVALFAPVIAPYGYAQLKDANGVSFPAQAAPSSEHIWGTTAGGYDVFSRVIWGSRTAVIAIVIAVLLSIFAGVLLGLVSGYFGGWVDRMLVMIADAIYSFPSLLLAILMLCLLAWRLTPHTFEEITASDQNAITSLAGAATFLGVRDGRAYTESYALQNVLPEDTAFEGILMLLNSTRYQEDFRNLLPWPIEAVSAGRAFDGRSVSLMLVWGPSEDECCSLSLSGRQIVVSRPHHDGFLIYHPTDPKLLNWLAIYLANNGEKG